MGECSYSPQPCIRSTTAPLRYRSVTKIQDDILSRGNGNSTTILSLKVFTQRNFVADFIRLKITFIQKTKNRFLNHPLGDLGVTNALHPNFQSSLENVIIGTWAIYFRLINAKYTQMVFSLAV